MALDLQTGAHVFGLSCHTCLNIAQIMRNKLCLCLCLELTGLDQAWETQRIGNTNKFMLSIKDSIVRIFT